MNKIIINKGISKQIAKAIVKEYPTFMSLFCMYENKDLHETHKSLLLSEIDRGNV